MPLLKDVSITSIEKYIKQTYQKDKEDENPTLQAKTFELLEKIEPDYDRSKSALTVLPYVSLEKRSVMLKNIVDIVFAYNRFNYGWTELAINREILKAYTNVKVDLMKLELVNELVKNTDIMKKVISVLGDEYDNIHRDAIEAIEYKKQEILKENELTKLFANVSTLISNLATIPDYSTMVNPEEVATTVDKLSNTSPSDIAKLVLSQRITKENTAKEVPVEEKKDE